MKCITVCSSRSRPEQLKRMIHSYIPTKSDDSKMFVYISKDDPKVNDYKDLMCETNRDVSFMIGSYKYMCHVLNYAALVLYPDAEFYHEANDDHVFVEYEWDHKMQDIIKENKIGICSGEMNNHLPTAIMVSGDIVRTLGYWFPPAFQHHSCDLFIEDIGKYCGLLLYPEKVYIEHMHQVWGKAEIDDNYRWVYSKEQQDIGTLAYEKWKIERRKSDINKINKLKGI